MTTEQQTVESVLRDAGWVEDEIRHLKPGEIFYKLKARMQDTRGDLPSGDVWKALRAPRPEPEYQLGDIRLVTYKDHDPVEMVLTRSVAKNHVWVAVDATTCAWLWMPRIHADSSYITAVELRPQDKPQTEEPAPEYPVGTVAVIRHQGDTREFVAYRESLAQWAALTDYDWNPFFGPAVVVEVLGHTSRENGFTKEGA